MDLSSLEEMLTQLARRLEERYYGKYRGFVHKNDDPQRRGRLRLLVPSVLKDKPTDWALPCLPFGGVAAQGMFMIPEENAQVWVEFEEGDKDRPIWTGTFWQDRTDVPGEATTRPRPSTRILKTAAGHLLQFDDEPDQEGCRLRLSLPATKKRGKAAKAEITLDAKGSLKLLDAKGSSVTLDADSKAILVQDASGNQIRLSSKGILIADCNQNAVELSASGIKIHGKQILLESGDVLLGDAGGEPLIAKGRSFIQKYMTHVHPVVAVMKPTEPPIPQGEPGVLSKKIKPT